MPECIDKEVRRGEGWSGTGTTTPWYFR